MNKRLVIAFVLGALALAFLLFLPAIAGLLTDWYWFTAVGFESVFLKTIGTKIGLAVTVGVLAFAFFYMNLRVAQRGVSPAVLSISGQRGKAQVDITRVLRQASLPLAAVLALMLGGAASGEWLTVLEYLHRTPFGEVDPVFGRDIAYYFFSLPALTLALGLVMAALVIALFTTVSLYFLRRDIVLQGRRVLIEQSAEMHIGVLVTGLFLATAANLYLIRTPSLVYSTVGPLVGASYSDLAVRVPLYGILAAIAVLGAVAVLVGTRTRTLVRNTAIAGGVYIAAGFFGILATSAIQKFSVLPNELVKESPQLEYHIAATNRAWGLDHVEVRDLDGEATLTLADLQNNRGTIRNIRLWDRAPLLQTFRQLQEIRTYYDFQAVDDDRYWIDGEYRQVLLSARELNSASLPTRNFINERLGFTHGMGLTLSPVNEVTPEGLPELFVKDLPPVSTVSLSVERPGVYYGELPNSYVFVNTNYNEFDYPLGDSSAFTVYDGLGGVPVKSFVRRLLFSIRFRSMDLLLTEYITAESRVMYYRRILERAGKVLPFLRWDRDPYIVITDNGRLKWILDAYTVSSRYPYSAPIANGVNYMRNSVKVVIDAYDGDITAYIAEPDDPIIQTYAKIFPDVLTPMDEMPDDLRAHIRFPSDLFRIQTALYTTYHMDSPDVFYAREDQWQIPSSTDNSNTEDPFLRHIIMKLPGESQEEYITMTPFTPHQKDNLAAWMVARSDGEHYGKLVVYRFPRQSLVFGPTQIVNRINQDTEVSRQISLWDQRGSEVIRGSLLVIPIEGSLLFVQAIYLRAEGGRIPELKRVIVAHQNQVVMEETLNQALARLFGGTSIAGPPVSAPVTAVDSMGLPTTSNDPRVAGLARNIAEHYDAAIAAQRIGDWAVYGEQMRVVGELVGQLRALVGN